MERSGYNDSALSDSGEGTQNAVTPQIIYATALVDGWEPDGEQTAEPESAGYFPDGSFVVSPSTAAHEIEWLKSKARDANGLPVAGWKMTPEGHGADCLYHFFPESAHQEAHPETSFEMTLDYVPRNAHPGIALLGVTLIKKGEILAIVAPPASGKTNYMEVVPVAVSSTVSDIEAIDLLGVSLPAATQQSRCLVIDTERTHDDVHSSYKRAYRRLGGDRNAVENGRLKGVECRCFIELATVRERKAELLRLLGENAYDYLIIDGAIDFVDDANDLKESVECVRWLRAIAAKYNLCLITTIHPNPGSTKPVGHLGTYLCRWSRAVLILTKDEQSGHRLITNDFEHGKLSHSSETVVQGFGWDTGLSMFTSVGIPNYGASKSARKKTQPVREIIEKIFNERQTTQIGATELKKILLKDCAKTEWQAKNTLRTAVEFSYLQITGEKTNAVYSLCNEAA